MGDNRNKNDLHEFWEGMKEGFHEGMEKNFSKKNLGKSSGDMVLKLPLRLLEMFVFYQILTVVTGTALQPKEYEKNLYQCQEGKSVYLEQLKVRMSATKTISSEDLKILEKFDPAEAANIKAIIAEIALEQSKNKLK